MLRYVRKKRSATQNGYRSYLKLKGETDEASDKKTNEKSTHACRNCLHIDFSAGSYGAGNAFY